ncbi:MAG: ABC transporter substrate-binding protein [Burkholderiaceae bacterium]
MNSWNRRRMLGATAAASAASMLGMPLLAGAQGARGGVLVVGTTQKPRHLNSAVQSGSATMFPAAQLFASPLRMNAQWEPQPYLAKTWDFSADSKTLVLEMREDAVFHDGHPITAEDLAFSLQAIKANHPFKSMYAPLESVVADGRHRAVITLSQPHPALLLAMSTSLTPVIPKHVFDNGEDLKRHSRNASPVGSGPFKLVEFKPGQHLIMERHDRFFIEGAPRLERLIIREYKDITSLLLAFERGEVDALQTVSASRDIERARKVPGATVVYPAAPAIGPLVWLAMNIENTKLADKRVRQAISYAIDRKVIVDSLLNGEKRRATGPITSGSPFYNPDVQRYDHDLAKANQLLDAAGAKRGANGIRFTLDVDCPPGFAELTAMQEYMKPSLAEVGIEANVRLSPDFPTWAKRVSSLKFEVSIDGVWNWGDPVIGVHRTWLSTNIRPGVIWSNTQSYVNPRVDELLNAAAVEMDTGKRKALYAEMQKIVVDDCPVAFLYESAWAEAYSSKVTQPPKGIWGMIDSLNDLGMS